MTVVRGFNIEYVLRGQAMAKGRSVLTAAAGEHFVAYRLSERGWTVSLTRGGARAVDMMVCHSDGKKAICLQVKTSDSAFRPRVRKPEDTHWQWRWSKPAKETGVSQGDDLFYVFVDLCREEACSKLSFPKAFVVPSKEVAARIGPDWTMALMTIKQGEESQWLEAWHLLEERLHA